MVVSADALSKDEVTKLLGLSTRTITTYIIDVARRTDEARGHAADVSLGRLEFQREEVLAWWRGRGRPVPELKAV